MFYTLTAHSPPDALWIHFLHTEYDPLPISCCQKYKGSISKKVQYNMDITQPSVPITKNVYHSF